MDKIFITIYYYIKFITFNNLPKRTESVYLDKIDDQFFLTKFHANLIEFLHVELLAMATII